MSSPSGPDAGTAQASATSPPPTTRSPGALAAAIGDRPGRLKLAGDMEWDRVGKAAVQPQQCDQRALGLTILEQAKQRDYRRVFAAAIVETLDLLDRIGIRPAKIGLVGPRLLPHVIGAPDFLFRNLFLRIQKIDPQGRGSMAADFAAGRRTEVDYLNGEVVRLAERLGRQAPVNAAITALVKQHELGVERVWSARDLRELCAGRPQGRRRFRLLI